MVDTEMEAKLLRSESSSPLWRNRDFLLLFGGQAVSLLGTQISTFALPLLMLDLSNSPIQAGFIATVQRLPFLLLSLPVGALIDRWNRKFTMLLADMARFFLYGSLPIAYALATLTIGHLYMIAVLGGIALVFFDLAHVAAVPYVVSPKHLPVAAAWRESTSASADLLGSGIGGFLLGLAPTIVAGAALAYLADSLSYLISVLGLATIHIPFQGERLSQHRRPSLWHEVATGLHFLQTHAHLRPLALLSMSINGLIGASTLAMVILARNELHLTALELGLSLTVGSGGGIVGALFVPWLKTRAPVGQLLLGVILLWIASTALLALAFSPLMLIIGWTIFTLASSFYFATAFAYRANLVPDELQGRVNSLYRTMLQAGMACGSALGGLFLSLLGARLTFWVIALGLLFSLCLLVRTELRHAQ